MPAHARQVLEAKPRVKPDLLAIAVSPLAAASVQPDVVHFVCDTMQAYHIIGDWMASQRIDNFHPSMSVNSCPFALATCLPSTTSRPTCTLRAAAFHQFGQRQNAAKSTWPFLVNTLKPWCSALKIARYQEGRRFHHPFGRTFPRRGHLQKLPPDHLQERTRSLSRLVHFIINSRIALGQSGYLMVWGSKYCTGNGIAPTYRSAAPAPPNSR